MIGILPKSLSVNNHEYSIRSDYRVALLIFQAFNDPELNDIEKLQVMIECLYEDEIPQEDIEDAVMKANWFLDCGKEISESKQKSKPLFDWEQDEQIIFSSINKVAGYEVRAIDYIHWWSFIGLFNEIGEGTFATVVSIRDKKNKGRKLESWESEFARKNADMITLNKKYSEKEKEENEFVRKLLTGGV